MQLTEPAPPTAVQGVTSSASPLPVNALEVLVQEFPESGNLLQPLEGEVEYGESLQSLPPGPYLMAIDTAAGTVGYASLDGSRSNTVLRMGEGLPLPDRFTGGLGRLVLADLRRTSRIYDLTDQTAWEVGPICLWETVLSISPDGRWIAADCESSTQLEEVAQPHTVVEILSTDRGVGLRIALPKSPDDRQARAPFVFWIGPRTLIASNVWIDGHLRTCGFSLDSGLLNCPALSTGGDSPSFGGVEPDGQFVTLIYRDREPWESVIVPKTCFDIGGACPVTILKEPGTIPILTPNPDIVWWMPPLEPSQRTHIGVYRAPDWQSRQVAELPGQYGTVEVCPNGECLFLEDLDTGLVYRLDLDGTLTSFPFGEIIGSFTIP